MINGVNHITIAVNDIDESFAFYVDVLGMHPHAKWKSGAYLTLDNLWFCLSCDNARPSQDYSHLAFSVSQQAFGEVKQRLEDANVITWKENTSEGDSFYFLDPNGHKLELHCGDLASRLASLKTAPYQELILY